MLQVLVCLLNSISIWFSGNSLLLVREAACCEIISEVKMKFLAAFLFSSGVNFLSFVAKDLRMFFSGKQNRSAVWNESLFGHIINGALGIMWVSEHRLPHYMCCVNSILSISDLCSFPFSLIDHIALLFAFHIAWFTLEM